MTYRTPAQRDIDVLRTASSTAGNETPMDRCADEFIDGSTTFLGRIQRPSHCQMTSLDSLSESN
jgi:hypothetical protein